MKPQAPILCYFLRLVYLYESITSRLPSHNANCIHSSLVLFTIKFISPKNKHQLTIFLRISSCKSIKLKFKNAIAAINRNKRIYFIRYTRGQIKLTFEILLYILSFSMEKIKIWWNFRSLYKIKFNFVKQLEFNIRSRNISSSSWIFTNYFSFYSPRSWFWCKWLNPMRNASKMEGNAKLMVAWEIVVPDFAINREDRRLEYAKDVENFLIKVG